MKNRNWVSIRAFDWGDECGHLLDVWFPKNAKSVAATCRIELRGKKSHRSEGKPAYDTSYYARMQSFGEIPEGFTGVQSAGHWITTTNKYSLEIILAMYGLTLDDAIEVMGGMPADDESVEMTLHEVVTRYEADRALEVAAVA